MAAHNVIITNVRFVGIAFYRRSIVPGICRERVITSRSSTRFADKMLVISSCLLNFEWPLALRPLVFALLFASPSTFVKYHCTNDLDGTRSRLGLVSRRPGIYDEMLLVGM